MRMKPFCRNKCFWVVLHVQPSIFIWVPTSQEPVKQVGRTTFRPILASFWLVYPIFERTKPTITNNTPPPTPPLATCPSSAPMSIPAASPAIPAISGAPSIPKIDPPRPPPKIPAIELIIVPWFGLPIKRPTTLPPTAPETRLRISPSVTPSY